MKIGSSFFIRTISISIKKKKVHLRKSRKSDFHLDPTNSSILGDSKSLKRERNKLTSEQIQI